MPVSPKLALEGEVGRGGVFIETAIQLIPVSCHEKLAERLVCGNYIHLHEIGYFNPFVLLIVHCDYLLAGIRLKGPVESYVNFFFRISVVDPVNLVGNEYVQRQFFFYLAAKTLPVGLSGIHLSTRKLPHPTEMLSVRTRTQEDFSIFPDDGCADMDEMRVMHC